MPEFTYVVTQRVAYYHPMEFENAQAVLDFIESGDGWDHSKNEVLSDRVQVFDKDDLVLDTEPAPCVDCGRDDHAGFRAGEPRCHRHLIPITKEQA